MSKKLCIVLVGPPCSGKSAVGKTVASASITDVEYISSGDIAREMARYSAQIGIDLSAGKMAPEAEMRKSINLRLWQAFIEADKDIVILDGFPRFGDQANWLRNKLPYSIDIKYVLFYASPSIIAERSANRNRTDDKSIDTRLQYYYNTTLRELQGYINTVIDADINTIQECSNLLIKYIEEVANIVKDCET